MQGLCLHPDVISGSGCLSDTHWLDAKEVGVRASIPDAL